MPHKPQTPQYPGGIASQPREVDPWLAILDRTLDLLNAGATVEAMVDAILPAVARAFPDYSLTFGQVTDARYFRATLRFAHGEAAPLSGMSHDLGQAPAYLSSLLAGEVFVVDDISRDPRVEAFRALMLSMGSRSMATIPVTTREGLAALLALDAPVIRDWSPADVELLARIGRCVELGLRQARHRREADAAGERLRAFLNALPVGVFVVERDGSIVLANEAARHLGAYRIADDGSIDESLPPARPHDLVTGEPIPIPELAIVRALQGVSVAGDRVEVRGARGNIPIEVHAEPIRDETGEVQQAISAFWDITAQLESERRKDEFVSLVSHELRTPLTAIHAALQLLPVTMDGGDSATARTLVDVASRNSGRLVRIVNDILDMQKIASGRVEFDIRPMELASAVHEAHETLEGLSIARDVAVVVEVDQPAPVVRGDHARLVQVITNLLSNALKFSPPGSEVTVRVSGEAGWGRVEVVDHGPGIPEEFRDRVFDRFAQVDGSASREHSGSGLGLAIARAMVERLGGEVDFTGTPGGGATFWLMVPLVFPPEAPTS